MKRSGRIDDFWRHEIDAIDIAPVCPEDGADMHLRTNGKTGEKFWGCPNWRPDSTGCTQTIPCGVSADTGVDGVLKSAPRLVEARPLRSGHEVTFYQYLTVPLDHLARVLGAEADGRPVHTAQWRLEHRDHPVRPSFNEATERALAVLEKLTVRGSVTVLSGELERLLSEHRHTEASWPARAVSGDGNDGELFDSIEERLMFHKYLTRVFGTGTAKWVTPQVAVATLTGDPKDAASDQRVDFLVWHPALERPIVVEIDGAQHKRTAVVDGRRNRTLKRWGYEVARIPASEVRDGAGTKLDALLDSLTLAIEGWTDDAAHLTAYRRAGQIQLALFHAFRSGLLPLNQSRAVSVATDAVLAGELSEHEYAGVLADFASLVQQVGTLYGTELLSAGLSPATEDDHASADLAVTFHDAADGKLCLHVDDACLPFHISTPRAPVVAGRPRQWSRVSIEYFLRRIFRKDEFWEGQYEAIDRALRGSDTLVLLPTGSGKSIAFQLASLLLPGMALVIEPIRSLMYDQVANLELNYGITRAASITGDLRGAAARKAVYERLRTGECIICYVAPERFQIAEFREVIAGLRTTYPVSLIVIDEAHCVSEWGHDFRVAYLRVGTTTREVCSNSAGTPSLLALTGTASYAVLKDLQRELGLGQRGSVITPMSFDRKELHCDVVRCTAQQKAERLRDLLEQNVPSFLGLPDGRALRQDGTEPRPGLVFCPWVNGEYGVVRVRALLEDWGFVAEMYAGKVPKDFPGRDPEWRDHRRRVERAFKSDDVQVLACTKAFGMGIDKPNVRFTVHYCTPTSIEAFYQEAGRAGRNRRDAYCVILHSSETYQKRKELLAEGELSVEKVAEALDSVNRSQHDDVFRSLFFHTNSFRGTERELRVIAGVLDQWLQPGARSAESPGWLVLEPVYLGDEKGSDREVSEKELLDRAFSQTEKAIHRLLVIGVVDDYNVQYDSSTFLAHPSRRKAGEIIDEYIDYVASYSEGRARRARSAAELVSIEDRSAFILGIARQYLDFVNDVIEGGRRRAIRSMHEACAPGDGEQLRKFVIDFLTRTEFSDALAAVVEASDMGLNDLDSLLVEATSPRQAGQLRGQVARFLESYPDHPGLLALRALAEVRADDSDAAVVHNDLAGFLASAGEKYAAKPGDVAAGIRTALGVLEHASISDAVWLEGQSLKVPGFERGDVGRELVRQLGMDRGERLAWNLLLQTIDSALAAA